ncbi:MAG: lipopolysaccharide biosynthesis protein [Thermodesulfobacteriota bacterium]
MNFIRQLKLLSKDTLVYGFGNALGQLIILLTAPILTRIFVPSDYGVIALLQTMINFLIMIAGFNLISGVYRYYFEYDDSKTKKIILSTSFLFYLGFGLFFSSVTWIGAPLLEKIILMRQSGVSDSVNYEYVKYIRILSIGIVFSMMTMNFLSVMRITRQPYKYMTLNILQGVTNFALIILLVVYMKLGIGGALWASVVSNMIICLVGFFMVVKHYALVFSFSFLFLLFSYALPQFPSGILNWGVIQSNRFFLNYYASLTQQGYYAIAFKIGMIFVLFSTAFRLAWDPFALSIMKNKDAASTYSQVFTLYVVGFGLLSGCIALFAKPILIILTPESYHIAHSISFILIMAFLYQGSNNILGIGICISKQTKYLSYSQGVAFVVNIALNFLLIPYFYAWGAALAFVGGMIAQSFAYYYFAQHVYPIPYQFYRLHSFILILFSIIMVEVYIIKDFSLLYSTLTATLFVPLIGSLAWKLGLSPGERQKAIVLMSPFLVKWNLSKGSVPGSYN